MTMTPYARRLKELSEREVKASRLEFEREEEPDRLPVGNFDGRLDPTLRWGGSTPYNFLQQEVAPPAFTPYAESNLIAQAKVLRPRTWSALVSCSFDMGSEWAGSSADEWEVHLTLLIGVGQANIRMEQVFVGSPTAGFTPPGAASRLAPGATLVAFWEAVPAAEIDAQVIFFGTQVGSPSPFTGLVSAVIAPYYPIAQHEPQGRP